MKRIVKQFIILVVLAGCLPAALRAQCPPPQVKTTPGEHITLGTPDPNAGKKVCYKWSSSDCSSCMASDVNQPVISVNVPNQAGTYHFTRTKIGETSETCTITVIAEDTIEIVSITPRKQCYTEGDPITEADFIIVTNPAGLEGSVRLDQSSRTASCPTVTGLQTCEQTLTFKAYKNGNVADEETVAMTIYRGELIATPGEYEIPDAVQNIVNKINAAKPVVNAVNGAADKIAALLNKIPGLPFSFHAEPLTINANIGNSYGICCEGQTGHAKTTVAISGKAGVKGGISYPVNMMGPPPFTLLPPQLKLIGEVGLSASASASVSLSSCLEAALDINLGVELLVAGGVAWGEEEDFLCGAATLFAKPSLNGTWHLLPPSAFGVELHGGATIGANLKGKLNASWFKAEKNIEFVFCNIQLF